MELIKKFTSTAIILFVGLVIGLIALEVLLRILPVSITGIAREIPLMADSDIAFRHKPNQSTVYSTQCYSVPMSTNSAGFRDGEWNEVQRVAVLGDSFMEGVAVGDGQDFSSLLERLLGVPVMNLGQASFGTAAELKVYEKFVRSKKPGVVILMAYTENDIDDNDCTNNTGPNGTIGAPCGVVEDGIVSFPNNYYSVSGNHALRSFLREHCYLCRLIRNARISSIVGEKVDVSPPSSREVGWTVTREALSRLKTAVEADGARLIVSSVPSYRMMISNNTDAVFSDESRFMQIVNELGIEFIPLAPVFIDYQREHNLPDPYFSYSCDGHWNPLGHDLAASAIGSYLIGIDPISPTPKEILGESGYGAIYNGGIYVPPSYEVQ